MKRMRGAMRLILALLVCAFIALGVWLAYTVYSQGSRWMTSRYNTRLSTARQNVLTGDITDRNGITLATTGEDGTRLYNEDTAIRRALSQTVGDTMSMSGTGVETFHAGTLLGFSGSIIDRTWQTLTGQQTRGDDIRLTVDAELAAYASSVFPSQREGAIVVLNYKTGEILAMVSKPDYDPQALANRQTDSEGSGYLNRALQGQYPPGSVFKIVTLAAALENLPGVQTRTLTCEGLRVFGEGKVTCYGGVTHGELTLSQAFGKSCNIVFAGLAYEMGEKTLVDQAKAMGFNDNFSFRDIILYESSIPETMEDISELAWSGVGQGKILVTPMHMAMIAGSIANDGVMQQPQLIKQVTGVGGIPRLRTAQGAYGRIVSAGVADTIGTYMRKAVESGTASKAAIKGYTVCGKTGSAETSNDKSVATDAWFVGYVEDDAHPYAIAIVVEQGGAGGEVAAPVAAKVLKKAVSLDLS